MTGVRPLHDCSSSSEKRAQKDSEEDLVQFYSDGGIHLGASWLQELEVF